ncbi:MAG: undecaprenyldiphospho-muramoylpentapeptide beta-N-acetylglucosaminyltransferase [Clostridiales bacterium]|jgi:UDP-N-acetylglucosamine--N-acetylmuramyl-(pentapeptide) pyrophosphoryl-undecaprenol N-acetylglucosamine transferase|nr:undecaprenyldiphospho-muramoylpentapeptide beta-N-acetylglucosaminyltransferase [Clostridiales bacterium]
MKKLRIAISGGGTGGHIYPALAILDSLRQVAEIKVLYLGSADSQEEKRAGGLAIPFQRIKAHGLSRRSPKIVMQMFVNYQGYRQARHILKNFSPNVVVGTGGYVAAPVLRAAVSLGLPTLIHEQNAYPGLANKMLAPKVSRVCLTFGAAAPYFRRRDNLTVTGLPVRRAIMEAGREEAWTCLGLSPEYPLLLITGGSQGAQRINRAATGAYQGLLEQGWQILHLTGATGYEEALAAAQSQGLAQDRRLAIRAYLEEMEYALAAADLVLSRAGASFLSELLCRGLPAILAPYPFAAGDHQRHNARALEEKGAAIVIEDKELTPITLLEMAGNLLTDKERRQAMAAASCGMGNPGAGERIAELILELQRQN